MKINRNCALDHELGHALECEDGVHQGLLNLAYNRWTEANEARGKHIPMADWFGSLSEIEQAAVALGKLNQQVCNGGFNQWFDNGYAQVMADTCLKALAAMPQTGTVQEVTALLTLYHRVVEGAEQEFASLENECDSNEDGECTGCGACEVTSAADLAFRDLAEDDLNDRYYAVDEKFLAECEEFFGHAVSRMLAGASVVVQAHPLSVYPPGKPLVKLVGTDGNAFAVMGACRKAARKAGWSNDQIQVVLDEMQSGDYNHLLATAGKYFEVS